MRVNERNQVQVEEKKEKSVLISEHVLKSKGICSLSIYPSPLSLLAHSFPKN